MPHALFTRTMTPEEAELYAEALYAYRGLIIEQQASSRLIATGAINKQTEIWKESLVNMAAALRKFAKDVTANKEE